MKCTEPPNIWPYTMGMVKNAAEEKALRAKEIANGRLAMVAVMGRA